MDPPNTLLHCPLFICLIIRGVGFEKVTAPISEAVSMAKDKEVMEGSGNDGRLKATIGGNGGDGEIGC